MFAILNYVVFYSTTLNQISYVLLYNIYQSFSNRKK